MDFSFITDLFIGGTAGVVSRTLTAPIELYKIQKQNPFIPYATLSDVVKKEGILGLWKGNMVNCIRICPQMSINFLCYHKSNKYIWKKVFSNNEYVAHFFSGTTGGFISTICVYPLETTRSRLSLQINNSKYNGIMHTLNSMSLKEMYRGLPVGIIGFVPYNSFNFLFYHFIKDSLREKHIFNNNVSLLHLFSGGFAGMFSVMITYPTDLIRRRMHIQGFDSSVPKYNNARECCKKIFFHEGFHGFYRGLFPCLLKQFPATAIQFCIMEKLRYWFMN